MLPQAPVLPRVPADGGQHLRAANATAGVHAIDVLHPRAIGR